jgi:hypothetical protein
MTLLAGYLLFSLSTLFAISIFITACDEFAAQLTEASMPNPSVSPLVAFQVRNNKTPREPVVVDLGGRFEVRFPDGRRVKCANLATARCVRDQG